MARDWSAIHPPADRSARETTAPACCAASGRAAFLSP
jgi:hypothetical protein